MKLVKAMAVIFFCLVASVAMAEDPDSGGGGSGSNAARIHVVKKGETLGQIGIDYGVKWQAIQAANSNIDPKKLPVNFKLVIPDGGKKKAPAKPALHSAPSGKSYYSHHGNNPVGVGADREKFIMNMSLLPKELHPWAKAFVNGASAETPLKAVLANKEDAKRLSGKKVFTEIDYLAYRTKEERKAGRTDGRLMKNAEVNLPEAAEVKYLPREFNGKIYNLFDDPFCNNIGLVIEDAPIVKKPAPARVERPVVPEEPAVTKFKPERPSEKETAEEIPKPKAPTTPEEQKAWYQNLAKNIRPSGKLRAWQGYDHGYQSDFDGIWYGGRATLFPTKGDFRVGGMVEATACNGRFGSSSFNGRYDCVEQFAGGELDWLHKGEDGRKDNRDELIVGFGKYDGHVSFTGYRGKNTADLFRLAYNHSNWNDDREWELGGQLTWATDNRNMFSLDGGRTYRRGNADNQSRILGYAGYFWELDKYGYPNIDPGVSAELGYDWAQERTWGKIAVGAEFYDTVKVMLNYTANSGSKNDTIGISANWTLDPVMDYLIDKVLMAPFKMGSAKASEAEKPSEAKASAPALEGHWMPAEHGNR